MNLFGVLFVRKGCVMNPKDFNHEAIHTAQMREMFYIFFYIMYLIEWGCLLCWHQNGKEAYRQISFEKEAYANQYNMDYLKYRKCYSQYKSR